MSPPLAALSQRWITSLVVGRDLVPRASFHTVHALVAGAVAQLHAAPATSTKHAVASQVARDACASCTTVERCCGPAAPGCAAALFCCSPCLSHDAPVPVITAAATATHAAAADGRPHSTSTTTPVATGGSVLDPWFDEVCRRRGLSTGPVSSHPCLLDVPPLSPAPSPAFLIRMCPPGRLLHLVRLGVQRGTPGCCTLGKPAYHAMWTHASRFVAPLASVDMVRDHLPDVVAEAVESVWGNSNRGAAAL